ncbi:MAG: cytochrome c [Gammaproteobacteria bacterium]|nr:cytochrome c [Gammaproteobacteria bacterium]
MSKHTSRKLPTSIFVTTLISVSATFNLQAADGETILNEKCVQCHEIKKPGPDSLQELWQQKGPNLSYAGNKYKQAWLEHWLIKPSRIRPAGMFYGNHIKPGEERDVVDASSLSDHTKLVPDQAKAVASTLMKFKNKSELIKQGAYIPGNISLSMGDLLFVKIRGCSSCHQIEADYGGLSGPEVYTAASRLQEDYIVSFLKNPQAWSPKTFMPNYELNEKDIQKFVHYFRALAGEK